MPNEWGIGLQTLAQPVYGKKAHSKASQKGQDLLKKEPEFK